jgi:nucleotide-binding universal stress UspA family protein
VSAFSDDELVDLVLGLNADPGLADAVDARPSLRRRCSAIEADLRCIDDELLELVDDWGNDRRLRPGPWRILLAVDWSSRSRKATQAALALALQSGGVVEVLHVCELGTGRCGAMPPGQTRSEAAAMIDPLLGDLHEGGVAADLRLRSAPAGQVAEHILWEAQEIGADVIVIGAGSPSRLAALRAPRVGAAVIRRSGCPVLVV